MTLEIRACVLDSVLSLSLPYDLFKDSNISPKLVIIYFGSIQAFHLWEWIRVKD